MVIRNTHPIGALKLKMRFLYAYFWCGYSMIQSSRSAKLQFVYIIARTLCSAPSAHNRTVQKLSSARHQNNIMSRTAQVDALRSV